ncbi:uncharacterized protein FTJAE_1679 [Fusarium tjaetaba]|uniref:Uncharacterized protein n=1 Tax=Fusarium tjaetaba TaxID=1567544 RepID=A0A8H5S9I4_9HYPO|nr:uncharacterized protein FTJAE_1679 [Fusarium tjaetaba]KAF5647623.1 hypothetical protein FTJAE_1679 [Fusarium tjaetaba]
MSSSSDDDEVESVAPIELSEYETDFDRESDLFYDSNYESETESERANNPVTLQATMSGPSCGLCRFEFEVDEEFVVYNPVSERYPRIWCGEYVPGCEKFFAIELGFHHGCVALLKPKTLAKDWTHNLSHATSGPQDHYLPPVSWTKRRAQWIRDSIAADLTQAIHGRLPQEICQYIASFCIRERACLILRDLSLSTRRLTEQDTLVYKARYRKQSARNRPEACLNIYYSEDHGGIRQVIITEDNEMPTLNMEPGLSWSIHRHQKTPLRVKQDYKYTRLRSLRFSPTPQFDETYEERAWGVLPKDFDSFPQIPLPKYLHANDRNYYESVRAVDWNSPGICGYSFCVHEKLVRGIVAHKLGEPEPKARDEYSKAEELWFHMPIDPDERVSELWLRKGTDPMVARRQIDTLIVRTNKGRTFTPGLDTCCSVPVGGALKFTANWLWEYLVFEQEPDLGNKGGDLQGVVAWDQHEMQYSFPPPTGPIIYLERCIKTSASLSDVRTVAPCREWSATFHGEVVGLLLTYCDGRRRSVGHVRLDCLEPAFSVSSSDCFWLGFAKHLNEDSEYLPWYLKVTSFGLSEPLPNSSTTYIKVPFSGRLEWASCGWISAVRHVEEGEPCDDEISQVMAGQKGVLEYASPEIKTFAVPIRVRENNPR